MGFGKPWPADATIAVSKLPIQKESNAEMLSRNMRTQMYGKPNKKVKNATKHIGPDGMKFDSGLEMAMYYRLQKLGIPFEFQHKIVLIEGYHDWHNKRVRPMTWTADFYFPWCELLLDTKGYPTDTAKMKIKLCGQMMSVGILRYNEMIISKNKGDIEKDSLSLLSRYQNYKRGIPRVRV